MNEENDPNDLLGAINAAFPEENGDATADETPAEETPAEEVAEGEEQVAEGEEEIAEGEEEAEEGEEGEEGEEEAEGEEGAEGAPGAKAKAKAEPEFDPLTSKLPKGTLQRTVDSFERLREVYKEATTRAETAENQLKTVATQHDELINNITGAGLDGERFNVMLSYASHFNSPVFEDRQKAYKFLMGELTALAKDLGETPPGVHPLTGHDDLIAEVRANPPTLTLQRAVELAQQRNRDAAKNAHTAKFGEQQQRRQADTQAREAARGELTTVGKELAQKDGKAEFQRKSALVLKEMKDDIMALPPQRWAAAFRKAYMLIPSAPKAAPAKNKIQPLRGNRVPAGGGARQPKTLQDAVFSAFSKSE